MFDWITGIVDRTGYLGVALLMFAENLFPPIHSELIMPLAGYTAARGELSLVLVVAAGVAGTQAGALFWYWIGRREGADRLKRWAGRHGRWLTLSPGDVDEADAWFDRHGAKAVLLGRLIPAVRTLISVPAGLAAMPLPSFLLWSGLGTALWTGLLAAAGYLLEDQHQKVAAWLNPASNVVLGLILAGYLYRVATFGRRRRASEGSS